MPRLEPGQMRHNVDIYIRTQAQSSGGDLSDTATKIGSRRCKKVARGIGGQQDDAGSEQSYSQYRLMFNYDRELMRHLTAIAYFVVTNEIGQVLEAESPAIDPTGNKEQIWISVVDAPAEDTPSES